MPIQTQSKARVLQSGNFRSWRHDALHADLRILAATNKDLEKAVEEGTFRKIFYRLNGSYSYPPLRHRREDIRPLADFFSTHRQSEK